ncbi:hypothetical protein A3C37_03215 [Candidatus Peribacteria bacterium RIFCSPHIGHO2_02_FULL_53_20]|nr:MAG: hypothetical protein A3C37_03215 [Candidatus Peribacteria bacterium RIFCSPHIGHO2_02_FULL_53_20]OGJ67418.1 MAG: hypothetical protein A3B61_00615 [Candidatus Peribacteria bacterium RIFCSPLOWO2_01_FULL_53_10]OGJ72604.1 MAG: hypothetical protein A3G69_01650 [Candidatus Peribacteria bacterium RIFCSPLOWO2_12_FULL_53_10]HLC66888.1 hypothetical protein [Candidatus Nanoarchaeia archaeon]
MTEIPKSIEAGESEKGPVGAEIGWVRRASYATVNGLNDAVEFAGTAAGYTVGRTWRTTREAATNVMKGRRGEKFGLAA